MGIAESMKGLAEGILASYDARIKVLGGIVADTHKLTTDARKTIECFTQNRKEMAAEQAESLSNFVKDLAKDVSGLLKEFGKKREEISEEQAKIFEEQTEALTKFVKNLAKDVDLLMNDFNKKRQEMSKELKDKLEKEIKNIQAAVKNIINDAQKLVGEYRSDIQKARHTWQGMASDLAKSRKKSVIPTIEAEEEKIAAAEKTVKEKGKKRSKKAKRGRR